MKEIMMFDDYSLFGRLRYPELVLPPRVGNRLLERRIKRVLDGRDTKRVKKAVEEAKECLRLEGLEPIYDKNGNPCRPLTTRRKESNLYWIVGIDGERYRIDNNDRNKYILRLQEQGLLPEGDVEVDSIIVHIGYYRKDRDLYLNLFEDSYPVGTQERERLDLDMARIYSKDIVIEILTRRISCKSAQDELLPNT